MGSWRAGIERERQVYGATWKQARRVIPYSGQRKVKSLAKGKSEGISGTAGVRSQDDLDTSPSPPPEAELQNYRCSGASSPGGGRPVPYRTFFALSFGHKRRGTVTAFLIRTVL